MCIYIYISTIYPTLSIATNQLAHGNPSCNPQFMAGTEPEKKGFKNFLRQFGLVTENVGLIFPMIASHLKTGLSDQQNHWDTIGYNGVLTNIFRSTPIYKREKWWSTNQWEFGTSMILQHLPFLRNFPAVAPQSTYGMLQPFALSDLAESSFELVDMETICQVDKARHNIYILY